MNTSETTLNGVRSVVEIRSADTRDGDVAELAYLVLFNERETQLHVVAGDTEGTIGPNGGFLRFSCAITRAKSLGSFPMSTRMWGGSLGTLTPSPRGFKSTRARR